MEKRKIILRSNDYNMRWNFLQKQKIVPQNVRNVDQICMMMVARYALLQTMNAHSELPFILIGDAGEVDVDIYLRIAEHLPDRVKAIYIRSVKDSKRMARIRLVIASVSDVEILLFTHSNELAAHVQDLGLIAPEA